MQHDRLVISGGLVLAGSPLTGGFQAADVSVADGRIAEIGPDLPADGAQVIDARGTFVLPGFVDTHQHLWQTAMRGITAGWDLTDFLWGIRQNHASLFQPDDLFAGTFAGGLASLEAGTTTTIEYAYSLNTPQHADAAIAAIREAGIRAVWCYGLIDVPLERPYFDSPQRRWPEVRRVRSEHFASNRRDDLVTLGLGANDLFTYPWEVTRGEYALARELDLLLTSHINSVWQPDSPPEIEWLHRDGLLGPHQVCVHATTSSDHELQLLADAGASVASTPETELQMGLGFPIFARAAGYGVNAGLGADIQANNSPDPFVRMRLGMHAESLRADLPLLQGAGVSALHGVPVGPREILYHATLGGARALGLGDVTGSLEAGKAADIILVRNDQLHHRPITDPFATIVLQSHTADIQTVLVAGRVVKASGALPPADSARAVRLADASFERLDAAMGARGGRKPERPAGWLDQVSAHSAANRPAWLAQ